MWSTESRAALWAGLDAETWDLVVIGGGISGAGVAREAVRGGARVLLLEAKDFAFGTSSRSSKMVHGGLRYLASGQWRIAAESVRERERLATEAPGLVEPMRYVFPHYRGRLQAWGLELVLSLYDALARRWRHGRLGAAQVRAEFPGLRAQALSGAASFQDTLTDDVRLTLRVLRTACFEGAAALNYAPVVALKREDGLWRVTVREAESGGQKTVRARAVINAAGAWADAFRKGPARLRPLRGSHLVFPRERLPVAAAIVMQHPLDRRTLFLYPWAGRTVVGTTDLDHHDSLSLEPGISRAELAYLLAAANHLFPEAGLGAGDVLSTWAGVRPVVGGGSGAPSALSREHAVWDEDGLVTLAGGKLTTFRLMARDALRAAARYCPVLAPSADEPAVLATPTLERPGLDPSSARRLAGWYGAELTALLAETPGLETVPGTETLWAELVYACRHEAVRHLDDLLLRRTRLGLILTDGAAGLMPELAARCRSVLGWDEAKWDAEVARYRAIWRAAYSLPKNEEQ